MDWFDKLAVVLRDIDPKDFVFSTARGFGERPFRLGAEGMSHKLAEMLPDWMKGPGADTFTGVVNAYAQLAMRDRSPLADSFFDFLEYARQGVFDGNPRAHAHWMPKVKKWAREHVDMVGRDGGDTNEALAQVQAVIDAHKALDEQFQRAFPPEQRVEIDWNALGERLSSLRERMGSKLDEWATRLDAHTDKIVAEREAREEEERLRRENRWYRRIRR
ncbi:MAG: hypothetical protein COT89_01985 [Candidatus Colwellbacteria bacterium CG10_big_fil_rev_8_21_14_0_10_42_22]|uniref:Uncharacterized protein n=1 Tax=Candidatus Colwellbacteria bacterium CG10_big_fil_rev_8_21_14_0_10_42_22 TaxID=1974540 RepID=A0A2H0VI16_9BACT|nr:MAG: hypothetical protein COT89_01985 [Candidatus Colwellbacteria bacterium CG10_big_fil_rev_8_21_14_0_10_42_22]